MNLPGPCGCGRPREGGTRGLPSVLAAALALPGLTLAEPPAAGEGQVSLQWLSYRDRQPGLQRVRVDAPTVGLAYGLSERWSIEGSLTADAVSGASPRWHSAVSGASRLSERRRASEWRVRRTDSPWGLGLTVSTSDERDYRSRALAAEARWRSDDGNRTLSVGASLARDRIGSVDDPELDGRRRRHELSLSLTQVLTATDALQATLTLVDSRGLHSDPYKRVDQRPQGRSAQVLALRWNHHVEPLDATLRLQWRAWRDSWRVRAHTLRVEWVTHPGSGWTFGPTLRLHSQSAADFYYDPVYGIAGEPYPPGWFDGPDRAASADARLAAFGAVSVGARLAWNWTPGWTVELRAERYEQRSQWRVGGQGSSGLLPLQATLLQLGLTHGF